ncbi:enoyl-CoA hydratase/isomerase family protein [Euzebya tangerina]|uniref:enoyl-CoA hydratase/isomerase family protein n=1 Tax=Euzebya tangerina TaxID=591198 RepID=UPI000E31CCA9|nr:enoyl-CoA hydratase-related protein [Euzebya tangerina]
MGEFVSVTTDDHGVATIRLDRPPVNALNFEAWDEFAQAGTQVTDDDAVKAVVIWGGPKVFAAGADIKAMRQMSYQVAISQARKLQDAFEILSSIPKVTIAAVNGYALGGGCELAMTADFRYAADNAKFGQPEINLGLIPGAGGTQRLTRLIGLSAAKEWVYGGEMYDAQTCAELGLVDRVYPADEVYDRAIEAARRYAAGPFALRLAKKAIDEGYALDLSAALRLETELFASCFATEDQKIGMDAFIEKGTATFTQQ